MSRRRLATLVAVISAATTALVATGPSAGAASAPPAAWSAVTGDIHLSSPTVADVNGDGVPDVAVGSLDGRLYIFDGKTGAALPGWPQVVAPAGGGTGTAIESSPTIADLDNDGKMEVIVGAGSLEACCHNQQGGLVVFNANGSVRWRFQTRDVFNEWTGGGPDGFSEAVVTTPAVGDVDGDGFKDIVFGSFDHRLYAKDRNGNDLPGFRSTVDDCPPGAPGCQTASGIDNRDTIWSSPALFDRDADGRDEIYFGGDATNFEGCVNGGILRAINPDGSEKWHRCNGEIFQSSGAIGDIDGDGRMDFVIGAGTFNNNADSSRIRAYHLDDGSDVNGWPQSVDGPIFGSPAIGDIDGDHANEVVVSACAGSACAGNAAQPGKVYAFHGNGTPMWNINPAAEEGNNSEMITSPVIADVDGNGVNDVVVGKGGGMYFMLGTNGARIFDPIANARAVQNAAAVADFGPGAGWRVVAASRLNGAGLVESHSLRAAGTTPPWPQYRKSADHIAAPPPPPPPHCDVQGYWLGASDGGIFAFGQAPFLGSAGAIPLNQPVVNMAVTPSRKGYWLVASDGGIFTYGDAGFFGSTGSMHLNQPIVGMASTADGKGYWLVASDGGIFAFGDAAFLGSTGAIHLNKPIVGMAATPSGQGYWLVATDGGIFTFGDAAFLGSTGAMALNKPIVGMAATGDGHGYWLVATDGGIFTFGNAPFLGSTGAIPLNKPIVAMSRTLGGAGYRLVATDGGIFDFGDAQFCGSTGNRHLNRPVNAMGTAA